MYSKILVTGCGGDIGFSIGKILKNLCVAEKIIGCDITDNHPGEYVFDTCVIVEKAYSENYLPKMIEIIKNEKIELIIPTSEKEIRYLCENNFFGMKEKFLIASDKAMKIGFDKLLTVEMLKKAALPFPETDIISNSSPINYPVIVKSRTGCGSKDLVIVENEEEMLRMKNDRKEDIWQEYLYPDNQEYTCCVYRTKKQEIRTIVIKRILKGGLTHSGIVVEDKSIEKNLFEIARVLELQGSINVQLRMTNKGAVVFEINPRFSSTVMFRHMLGFKDLLWALMEKKHLRLPKVEKIQVGSKIYRVYDEIIFENTNK